MLLFVYLGIVKFKVPESFSVKPYRDTAPYKVSVLWSVVWIKHDKDGLASIMIFTPVSLQSQLFNQKSLDDETHSRFVIYLMDKKLKFNQYVQKCFNFQKSEFENN